MKTKCETLVRRDEFTNKYIRIKMLKGYKMRVIEEERETEEREGGRERERERRRDLKKKLIAKSQAEE